MHPAGADGPRVTWLYIRRVAVEEARSACTARAPHAPPSSTKSRLALRAPMDHRLALGGNERSETPPPPCAGRASCGVLRASGQPLQLCVPVPSARPSYTPFPPPAPHILARDEGLVLALHPRAGADALCAGAGAMGVVWTHDNNVLKTYFCGGCACTSRARVFACTHITYSTFVSMLLFARYCIYTANGRSTLCYADSM
jgi:hypothetical protein